MDRGEGNGAPQGAQCVTSSQFWDIWLQHRLFLWRYALKLTRSTEDAKDLLSCTLLRLATHIGRHEPVIVANPQSLLVTALRNEFLSQRRRLMREYHLISNDVDVYGSEMKDDTALTAEDTLAARESKNALLAAVDKLPPSYKRLFDLRFREERSYEQIAGLLGASQALIRKRIQLLRAKLRENMQSVDPEFCAPVKSEKVHTPSFQES
ncbi:MAG TPA: sigma-70 family RNA polymerase sigma factor [Dongiaceae bacterium]|jgi:RNA polymerase sigma-70 factor (ECF subfamily)|nr:sigma-70 family RNA polymerase sigma factor [Dongiaceae bacterium]